MKRTFLLIVMTLCFCAICQAQTSASFPNYYDGKIYESKVTPEMLERSPAWLESADSPPLSPRRALEVAEEYLPKFVSKAKKWRNSKISLYPVGEKWVYVVEFTEQLPEDVRKYDGPAHLFSVLVLMNGEVVIPVVKRRESP